MTLFGLENEDSTLLGRDLRYTPLVDPAPPSPLASPLPLSISGEGWFPDKSTLSTLMEGEEERGRWEEEEEVVEVEWQGEELLVRGDS